MDPLNPETWICLICGLASEFQNEATTVAYFYQVLGSNLDSPFAKPLAFFVTQQRNYGREINSLRLEIEELRNNSRNSDESMNEDQDLSAKKRHVLLIGNDLPLVKPLITERLPPKAELTVINHKSADMEQISREVHATLEKASDDQVFSVFIHPGVEQCLLREEDKMLKSIQNLIVQVKKDYPHTDFSIISVPQILQDVCRNTNDALQAMNDQNLIKYVALTKIQADMMLSPNKRNYSEETASRIANKLAESIASTLGVKVSRKPKKSSEEQKKQNKEDRGLHLLRSTRRVSIH